MGSIPGIITPKQLLTLAASQELLLCLHFHFLACFTCIQTVLWICGAQWTGLEQVLLSLFTSWMELLFWT